MAHVIKSPLSAVSPRVRAFWRTTLADQRGPAFQDVTGAWVVLADLLAEEGHVRLPHRIVRLASQATRFNRARLRGISDRSYRTVERLLAEDASIMREARMLIDPPPTLYEAILLYGIPHDHHESDLYVPDTPHVRALAERYGIFMGAPFVDNFVDTRTGQRWLDFAFSYTPFFEQKAARRS